MIRAIVQSVTRGAIQLVSATGRAFETFSLREFFQQYGFTSRPLPGAEGIFIESGNFVVMIATEDRRYRVALEEGEVALYTDEGDKIHFKRGREIEIVCGAKVTIDAPLVETTGDLVVKGALSSETSVADPDGTMAEMRTIYNGHTHSDPQGGASGAPTPGMV
jgi:phage gp45-like